MARTLVFLAEVESDIGEAYWWYEEKDLGLGDEFLRCLEEAFSRISDYPEQFPVRFDGIRRILGFFGDFCGKGLSWEGM